MVAKTNMPSGAISYQNLPSDSKVNQLINCENDTRKIGLLNDTFSKEEVELICSIPISRWGAVDKIVWGCSNGGKFSIKNAYHLEHKRIRRKVRESSKGVCEEKEWNQIWGLNVQGTIKHFLWTTCLNILPTKENLAKKQILNSSLCQFVSWNQKQPFMLFGVVLQPRMSRLNLKVLSISEVVMSLTSWSYGKNLKCS